MSLVAAGVQLDKLTVLTGAFGVGVGFGMQNIIGNFVSGLVLQFERPIRIGDVLEVGNLAGEVQRIGVRASLIRTFQGADVIVPNSNLVSNQVVNWTLSEPIRRVEIQVPVAYGTAPERVIQLLSSIASRSHRGATHSGSRRVLSGVRTELSRLYSDVLGRRSRRISNSAARSRLR